MLKNAKKRFSCSLAIVLTAVFCAGLLENAFAGDDDVPFFVGVQGLPNVMFVFDNSDSMQDVPYPALDDNGKKVPVRPDWQWRQGVKIDGKGFVVRKENGRIDLDETKYLERDARVEIPGRIPPPIPGLDGLAGAVTEIRNKKSDDRIYDANVDWDDPVFTGNGFEKSYKNYRVRIEDENGTVQYVNIVSFNAKREYWLVTPDIQYDADLDYSYTILTGVPDAVTLERNNRDRIYDCHVDWETAEAQGSFYRNKVLEIVNGEGALEGASSRIVGADEDGYWRLIRKLPESPPVGTRYRIVGSDDDDRYAKGGNHPDSKMYQAKKALKTFLESDKIKVCESRNNQGDCTEERYLVNFGFGTYMSARVSAVKAKYYRYKKASSSSTSAQYSGLYKTRTDRDYTFYDLHSSTRFATVDWKTRKPGQDEWTEDQLHRNVYVGYRIERLFDTGQCGQEVVLYTVSEIVPSPTDSSADRHIFKLVTRADREGGEPQYARKRYSVSSCEALPKTDAGWELVGSEDDCGSKQKCTFHPEGSASVESYYETRYVVTWGDYDVTDPSSAGYIDIDSVASVLPEVAVTPCPGFDGEKTGKCISVPNPELGDFTLVSETITDVPIDASQTYGDIKPNIFDASYFRYPADGSSAHPHGWSYQKTEDGRLYRLYKNYPTNWTENDQPEPYFPADARDDQANHRGDDQIVFINLPEYKTGDEDSSYGDDVTGQNVSKLLNYVGLARAESPDKSSEFEARYDYTMMPYTNSLPVNSEEEITGAGTPLAASLKNVRKYYESYIQQDDFTLGGCRNNYVILLTDGLETCDGNPKAEAAALYNMSVNGSPLHIKTYVIGFGLDEESREALDAIAEAGGTEKAYFAKNVEELVDVLAENIVKDIFGDSYSRSSPVLTRRSLPEDDLKIFTSYFDYPIWRGHLEGRYVENNGDIGEPLEQWVGDCAGERGPDADAGCEMARFGRGRVLTNAGGALVEFETESAYVLKDLVNPEGLDIDGDGKPGSVADASAIIEYVLDSGFRNNIYKGSRDEEWPLGDIYNSSAVWVGPPQGSPSYRPGYAEFSEENADRPGMVYVGANDGMLHAFYEDNGREAWAVIPGSVLHILNEYREGHRFTVDLKIKAADVLTDDGWKTILASGLREGGHHYYALDVTDPLNPEPLWEITDDNMGKTYSIPSFGQVSIGGFNTGVLFVGGGHSTKTDKGNRVYILRASDGEILSELTLGDGHNNVPSELLAVRFPEDEDKKPYRFHTKDPVQVEWRGNVEFCYFGDMSGTLWRLGNLNSEYDETWEPTLEVLYVPEHPRPVTRRPAVTDDKNNCHRRFVEFGTGDELNPTSLTQNHFYEVEDLSWEDYLEAHPDENLTASRISEGKFRLKWQYDLPFGEQLLTDPATYYNLVYFITYKPSGGRAAGVSYAYAFTTSECPASRRASGGGNESGEDDLDGGEPEDDTESIGAEPEGTGGGDFFGFPDLEGFGTDGEGESTEPGGEGETEGASGPPAVRPLEIPGITSSMVIAPPKAYLNPGEPLPVPTDPAIMLYWRETQ